MNVPPPILVKPQPAPPPPPSSNKTMRTILIVLGICTVVVVSGLVYGFFWLRDQISRQVVSPPPMATYPVVNRITNDGWAEMRFEALPLTIELPDVATPRPFMDVHRENLFNGSTKYLAGFQAKGKECEVKLMSIWPTPLGERVLRGSLMSDLCIKLARVRDPDAAFVQVEGAPAAAPNCIALRAQPSDAPKSTIQMVRETSQCVILMEVKSSDPAKTLRDAGRIMRSFR